MGEATQPDVRDSDATCRDMAVLRRRPHLGKHCTGRFCKTRNMVLSMGFRIPMLHDLLSPQLATTQAKSNDPRTWLEFGDIATDSNHSTALSRPSPFSPHTTISPMWPCFQKCTSEPQMPCSTLAQGENEEVVVLLIQPTGCSNVD